MSVADEGKKFDSEKVPLHLLPPDALWEIARALAFGAKKYDAWNWYKGINYSRLFGALLRHMWQWWRRQDTDPESSLSHLAHAGCCLLFLLQQVTERRIPFDDRPEWEPTDSDIYECGITNDGKTKLKPAVVHTKPDVDHKCNCGPKTDFDSLIQKCCGGDL